MRIRDTPGKRDARDAALRSGGNNGCMAKEKQPALSVGEASSRSRERGRVQRVCHEARERLRGESTRKAQPTTSNNGARQLHRDARGKAKSDGFLDALSYSPVSLLLLPTDSQIIPMRRELNAHCDCFTCAIFALQKHCYRHVVLVSPVHSHPRRTTAATRLDKIANSRTLRTLA